jgi:hypothetical protein
LSLDVANEEEGVTLAARQLTEVDVAAIREQGKTERSLARWGAFKDVGKVVAAGAIPIAGYRLVPILALSVTWGIMIVVVAGGAFKIWWDGTQKQRLRDRADDFEAENGRLRSESDRLMAVIETLTERSDG